MQRAHDENAQLLPKRLESPRILVLRGVDTDGDPVGRAWVGLDHPRGSPDVAFLYDIEVIVTRRGSGLGRALLEAVEEAPGKLAQSPWSSSNVFGRNHTAISLYNSSGYDVITPQMRKSL